jgi:lysozyme
MDNKNYFDIAKDFIKKFEGCKLEAYFDGGGVPTIGYGSTHYLDGEPVKAAKPIIRKVEVTNSNGVTSKVSIVTGHFGKNDKITLDEAERLLIRTIMTIDNFTQGLIKTKLTNNQRAAILSLTYNIGMGNFRFSTMLKKINDSDFEGAANEFERWKWDNGKVVNGLIRRRVAEKELFLS